ncbi:hypothetical protein ABT052_24635 [Streptomyces sp. NPDC002766]|uniref:hypothetical protein n=1 Tax=unclassified Streptomyces TaxID=2593676 RepID=UPI00331E535C
MSESAKNPEDEAEDIPGPEALGEGTEKASELADEGLGRQTGTGADSAARELLDRLAEQASDSAD